MKTRTLALGFEVPVLGGDTGIAKFHCPGVLPVAMILQYVRPRRDACILGRGRRRCTDEGFGVPRSTRHNDENCLVSAVALLI